ncbi:ENV2 protein, partial [Chroicocephalus maculipennis]|nr:ENV2 protein [Chroicocephalus maculipennis]NXX02955.1 ENV2 protein [Larus smithsonianus]
EPLWSMMQAAYQTLNETSPNVTSSCWLCYDTKPPFYEGIAISSPISTSNETTPSGCDWTARSGRITLQQVTSIGNGTCVG